MIIDQKDKTCDFCKRDEGLVIMPLRYLAIGGGDRFDEQKWADNITIDYTDLISLEQLKLDTENEKKEELLAETLKNESEVNNNQAETEVAAGEVVVADDVTVQEDSSSLNQNMSEPTTLHTIRVGAYNGKAISKINEIEAPESYGYTQSFLRAGFLYVYLEHSQKLEEYMVSPLGYLRKMAANSKNDIDDEPCDNVAHRQNARTITIPRIKELTNIYMAYSSVQWTEKVKKNMLADKSHLKKIDVKQWLLGQDDQKIPFIIGGRYNIPMVENEYSAVRKVKKGKFNLFKSKEIVVNGFADEILTLTPKFQSQEDFIGLTKYVDELVINDNNNQFMIESKNERLAKLSQNKLKELDGDDVQKRAFLGMAVSLDDPIGLAMDVGNYVVNFYTNAVDSDKYYNNIERTAIQVSALREQMKDTALRDDMQRRKDELELLQRAIEKGDPSFQNTPTADFLINSAKKNLEPLAQDIENIKNRAFDEYSGSLNELLITTSLVSAKAKELLIKEAAKPVENWFKELIKSPELIKVFQHFHDEENVENRLSYICSASLILQGISISEELNKCIANDYLNAPLEPKNFVLNAVAANHKNIKAKLGSPFVGKDELLSIQSAVFGFIGELKAPQLDALYDGLGQLFINLQPAIIHNSISGIDQFRREVALLDGWSTPKGGSTTLQIATWNGKASQLQAGVSAYAHEMALKNGSKRAIENMSKAMNWEISQQKDSSLNKFTRQHAGEQDIRVALVVRGNANINIAKMTNADFAKFLVGNSEIMFVEDPKTIAKTAFQGFLGVTGSIFQMLAVRTAFEAVSKTANAENITKFASTLTAVAYGSAAAVYQLSLARMQKETLMKGIAFQPNKFYGKLFSMVVGRFVLLITTFFNTIFDIIKGFKGIFSNLKDISAWLLFTSSALTLSSAIVLLFKVSSRNALSMILAIIGIGLYIQYQKRNFKDSLKIWFQNCMVGITPQYTHMDKQNEELQKIFN